MATSMAVSRASVRSGALQSRKSATARPVAAKALRPRTPSYNPFSDDLKEVFMQNEEWANLVAKEDPTFFEEMNKGQAPQILWVGCADSRVVANQLTGLLPGEMFVQRNVGNQFMHTDMNVMSALEYSVTALGVCHIVVCGHYNCGAVNAALTLPASNRMITNSWIANIRAVRNRYATELKAIEDDDERLSRLCELNVVQQVFNACTSNIVQECWENGTPVHVHGVIYGLDDGKLTRLVGPISSDTDLSAAVADADTALSKIIADDLATHVAFEKA